MTAVAYSSVTAVAQTDALLFGTQWVLDANAALTYSFTTSTSAWDGYTQDEAQQQGAAAAISAAQQQAVVDALNSWSSVADIQFVEVADDGCSGGILRIGYTTESLDRSTFAYAYGPGESAIAGDVRLNVAYEDSLFKDFSVGGLSNYVLLHELGHALGLKHPDDTSPLNGATLSAQDDTVFNSVMSYYVSPGVMLTQTNIDRLPNTPMALDIDAMQVLYGANPDHNSGDNVYAYDSEGKYLETIYDTGGIDAITVVGGRDAEIDLRPNAWSRIGLPVLINGGSIQHADTVRIYRESEIENAVGGAGDDLLIGNELANELRGEDGNDTLRGGGGRDTLAGGAGADTFVLQVADDPDVLLDFNVTEGDEILIADYADWAPAGMEPLAEGYFGTHVVDGTTLLWFDIDGASGAASAATLADLGTIVDGSGLKAELTDGSVTVRFGAVADAAQYFAISPSTANSAPTFDVGDGMVTSGFTAFDDRATSLRLQSDGKIVTAGYGFDGATNDFVVSRYNSDGSADTSFGLDAIGDGVRDGYQVAEIYATDLYSDTATALAIQSDGRIVAAGNTSDGVNSDFSVVRWRSDGALDSGSGGFASIGLTSTPVGAYTNYPYFPDDVDIATGVAESGGTLWVSGSSRIPHAYDYFFGYYDNNYDFAIARYNSAGLVDLWATPIGSSDDFASAIQVRSDGDVLVAGSALIGSDYDFALVRYNSDGSLDTAFSSDGKATTHLSGNDYANALAVQSDNKVVVAGSARVGSYDAVALVRYNSDGTLDSSFSGDGKVTTAIGAGHAAATSVAIQADGRILVGGYSQAADGAYELALVRYNTDGTLDSTFGTSGIVATPVFGLDDRSAGMAVQPDGKIVVTGQAWNGANYDAVVVRYNADGSLDLSFDGAPTVSVEPVFVEDGDPVVLDAGMRIYDSELEVAGSYEGATLTLQRQGGAAAEDVFAGSDVLADPVEGFQLVLDGAAIGDVVRNSEGVLQITFNAEATPDRVNQALRSLTYANTSDAPPDSVAIEWSFSDGNVGLQGSGGALSAQATTLVQIVAANDDAPSLRGSTGNDVTSGTAEDERWYGLDGADVAVGFAGNDLLDGGPGNDTLIGGSGDDTVVGGYGDDQLGSDFSTLGILDPGADSLIGGPGADILLRVAGDGNDSLLGGDGDDGFWFYSGKGAASGENSVAEGNDGSDRFLIEMMPLASSELGTLTLRGGDGADIYGFSCTYTLFDEFFLSATSATQIPEIRDVSLPTVVIEDFTLGYGGDQISVETLLDISASGWNFYFGGNPFAAGVGVLRLVASGDDTLLQWDMDGIWNLGGKDYVTVAVLKNVAPAELTGYNFAEAIPPDGSAVQGGAFSVSGDGTPLLGSFADDTLTGGSGKDQLIGKAGADTLFGEGDDDQLYGKAGDDTLYGGAGNDALYGNQGDDHAFAGDGDDYLDHAAGEGNDTLEGGNGTDFFRVVSGGTLGRSEDVVLSGDAGDDYFALGITGDAGNQGTIRASGGAGRDDYTFFPGFELTAAYDAAGLSGLTITDFATGTGGDRIVLLPVLTVSASGNNGYSGGDPFSPSNSYLKLTPSGADTLLQWDRDGASGAEGFRTLIVFEGHSPGDFTIDNFVEQATGAGSTLPYADDSLVGTSGSDAITGFAGDDTIEGGDGDDNLAGSIGNDALRGGAGSDTLDGGLGDDSLDGGADADRLDYFTGEGSDSLVGGSGDDVFYFDKGLYAGDVATISVSGDEGSDSVLINFGAPWQSETIVATGGADTDRYILGTVGNALVDGTVALPDITVTDFLAGAGGDQLDLVTLLDISGRKQNGYMAGNPFDSGHLALQQSGADTLIQWDRDGSASGTYQVVTLMTLAGIDAASIDAHNFTPVTLSGTAGDDMLWGGLGVDTLEGGLGNDLLDGNWGPDVMRGGDGGDTYWVDDAGDSVIESGIEGGQAIGVGKSVDSVSASVNYMLTNYVEYLTLVDGSAADTGTGNTLDNGLTANKSTDSTLTGLDGNDTLEGGNGIDTAVYRGNWADYTISAASGGFTVADGAANRDGTDTLTSIEKLQFADVTMNLGSNNAPLLVTALADQSADEDSAFNFVVPANAFLDVDRDTLTYSATRSDGSALPSWLSFDATTRAFSGTPANADVGSFTVRITASDGAASVYDEFTISIANTNDNPNGSVSISGTATQGETLTASHNVTDADGLSTVTYQWQSDSNGTWSNISGATSNTYTLTQAEVGKTIRVLASYTDGHGTAESVASSATSAVANVNDPPTLSSALADQNASEDSAFSFVVPGGAFTDLDTGDTLSYSATLGDGSALPAWLDFNAGTRSFSGTPGDSDIGSVTVRVTVTDPASASTADEFTLSIANVNDSPAGSVLISGTATQGRTLTASNDLSDADDLGTISYQWQSGSNGSWSNITGATSNTYTLTEAEVGKSITVTARYTDGHGTAESVTSGATSAVIASTPPAVATTITARYTVLGSGANFTDFDFPYSEAGLAGQNVVFKGNSGIDQVFVGSTTALLFDFTQAGLGSDKLYVEGHWADYAQSYTGSVLSLTRTVGGSETLKAVSGDVIVFTDGTVAVADALAYLRGTGAQPTPSGETSGPFPLAIADNLNNTVRAVVLDATGETLPLARPGETLIVKGGSGVETVYVAPGASVDAMQLGLGQDVVLLGGAYGDYSGSVSGSVVTLSRSVAGHTESVKFLGGSAQAFDSILFADGSATSIDVLNAVKNATVLTLGTTVSPAPQIAPTLVAGTAGADTLTGNAWANQLDGGGGQDTLAGLGGADLFVLKAEYAASSAAAADIVSDFEDGLDRFALAGSLVFEDIFIAQGNGTDTDAANTVLRSATGDYLAVLLNVASASISSSDFVMLGM